MRPPRNILRQSGSSMIEVLVTLIILLIGLLGLAGLMTQSQRSEMESYQRVQALVLLQDMAGRINVNRAAASCYAFTTNTTSGTPYMGATGAGVLSSIPSCAVGTPTPTVTQSAQAQQDMQDWNSLLTGAAETLAGSGNVGAMVGARGCVDYDATTLLTDTNGVPITGTGIYTISVAWQGLGSTFAPVGLKCAQGLYGNEAQRRVVSLTFRVGSINNNN